MRILVTGSRDWEDEQRIAEVLFAAVMLESGQHTLVTGACPTGADVMAERLVQMTIDKHPDSWVIERHSADWEACTSACTHDLRRNRNGREYCPAAGVRRNTEMVALGADVCVAFIKNNSRGATDCANKAEKAGIPTKRFRA